MKKGGTKRGSASAGCLAMRRVARWLLFLFVIIGAGAQLNGQSVTLAWSTSSDPAGSGSILWWGTVSGNYTQSEDVGTNTSATISNLTPGVTYYFAATCYDAGESNSGYSTEIAYSVPAGTTFTFANLTQTYKGAPESVTVTTSPTNVPVTATYNGSTNAPVNAGAYTVVATAQSPGSGSATSTFIINPAAAIVTLSGLAALYNGNAQTVTVTTSPAGLATTTTYNGNTAAPTNIGSYAVAATINNSNYTGSASGTLVISGANATVVLGNLAQIYSGNACPVTATTTPGGLTVNITYNQSATAPTNCGNYTVVGAISNTNYSASATNTLVISPATATFTLSGLAATYNGSARAVTVTTSPAGLSVNVTYNGSAKAPANAGSYTVVATPANANYTGGATNTLVIAKAGGTVTLSGLNQKWTGSAIVVHSRTVPAGLTVRITYNGSTQPPTNSGSYTVVGTIVNSNYTGSVTNTLKISGGTKDAVAAGNAVATGTETAQVTLFALNQIYDGTPKSVGVVTVPSGLTVTINYSADGASGNTGPASEGEYTVSATISDPVYTGGTTNSLSIYDPTNALILTWPAGVNNPTISTSTDLTTWAPLAVNIGPTNQLVMPKQPGNQFFQGPGLQIVAPSR